jgi:WD40 repeat protein
MIQSVTFSTDGAELLTACSDGMVRVFPTAGGDAIVLDSRVRFLAPNVDPNRRPEVEAPAARAAVFSPDGKWVAALCGDGPTRIWPANGGGPPVELMNAFGATSVAFDSASAALIAGTDQGTASIYSLAAPAEPRELPRLKDIYDAATSPDATVVAAVGSDGIARVWKEGRWRELRGAGAKGCAYDADRGRVAVAHSDGTVRVWNEALRDAIELHGAAPLVDVAFSPDGRFVYAWSKREFFRWELAHPPSGSRVSRFPGPASDIWSVSTSGDGVRVLITYDDGSIAVWRGDSGMRFRVHTRSVYEGVLNDDGTQAVTVSGDGTARVWTFDPDRRSATIRTVSAPAGETMDTVALSPDGRRFAATTSEGRALLAPVRRGKTQLLRTHGDLAHIGVILQARFSADGMHLLTCGAIDGAARYWDLSGRTNAVTLANHASTITQCAVSRDGRRVMTATENGWVRSRSVRFENVVAASAARTTATLTPQQRMMLLGETADDAYEHYALDERKHRRIPLPRQWSFDYPTW